MSIFDRMGRVISSNINALFDKVEDDEKLIGLNLEEMGDQLKRGRQDLVGAVAGEKQLRAKADALRVDSETWERRAELALKSGDEALAREALKHKLRVQKEVEAAERARVEQRDAALTMKGELERMERRLDELKLRKSTLVTQAKQARSGGEELGARGGSNAFAAFRAMEERIEGKVQQNAAMAEVEAALGTHDARDLEAKFRDLEANMGGRAGASGAPEVDDELAALKKRIRI